MDPWRLNEELPGAAVRPDRLVLFAGVGAVTYLLEILTGLIGSSRRWRTMPWLVVLFGIMIVPLGAVSIIFIVIQPIVIGTWCTLCLIAAAAMLIQIPYSLDELVATGEFLWRRKKAGRPLPLIFFVGDTDDRKGDENNEAESHSFERPPSAVLHEMITGGVNVPWNSALTIAIGVWLMFTRLTIGASGGMADADHLIGALVVTVTVAALAEVARPVRFLNMAFGAALIVTPFAYGAPWSGIASGIVCGLALIALSLPRGAIRNRYGRWTEFIV